MMRTTNGAILEGWIWSSTGRLDGVDLIGVEHNDPSSVDEGDEMTAMLLDALAVKIRVRRAQTKWQGISHCSNLEHEEDGSLMVLILSELEELGGGLLVIDDGEWSNVGTACS